MRVDLALAAVSMLCATLCGGCRVEESGSVPIAAPSALPPAFASIEPAVRAPRALATGFVPDVGAADERRPRALRLEARASDERPWTSAAPLEHERWMRHELAAVLEFEPSDADVWRVRGRSRYEVARYRPLDESLRGYAVQSGEGPRRAGTRGFAIPLGRLFALDVRVDHRKFEIGLDGVTRLEVFHSLFPDFGGVGERVIDEADNSALDDLPITPEE